MSPFFPFIAMAAPSARTGRRAARRALLLILGLALLAAALTGAGIYGFGRLNAAAGVGTFIYFGVLGFPSRGHSDSFLMFPLVFLGWFWTLLALVCIGSEAIRLAGRMRKGNEVPRDIP